MYLLRGCENMPAGHLPSARWPLSGKSTSDTVRKSERGRSMTYAPEMKRSYSTDLSDAEWEYLEPHVPPPDKRGRPRVHTTRYILEAIIYVLKSGCPWRLSPRDFPPWETVYCWFRRWRIDGTWEGLSAGQRQALGGGGPGFACRDRPPSCRAAPGEGGSHLGCGVDQGGPEG